MQRRQTAANSTGDVRGDRNGDGRRLEAQAKMMEARGKQWGNAIRWWVLLGIRNGAR